MNSGNLKTFFHHHWNIISHFLVLPCNLGYSLNWVRVFRKLKVKISLIDNHNTPVETILMKRLCKICCVFHLRSGFNSPEINKKLSSFFHKMFFIFHFGHNSIALNVQTVSFSKFISKMKQSRLVFERTCLWFSYSKKVPYLNFKNNSIDQIEMKSLVLPG